MRSRKPIGNKTHWTKHHYGWLERVIQRDITSNKKAVIVGGGPAGMEAARVLRERGMDVILFEASSDLGGQIALAAKDQLHNQIWGTVYWLQSQLERLDVDVRYNCYAEESEVLAEQPDLVIIATGGMPESIGIDGGEHAASSWDVLSGELCSGQVLLFDDHGDHHAGVAADVLAGNGAEVLHLTPDRTSFMELGPTNSAVVLRDLCRKGVQFEVLKDLIGIEKRKARKVARLRHTLTGDLSEKIVDHIVIERGIGSLAGVYEALKPTSRNAGIVDLSALVSNQLVLPEVNTEGTFDLVRIGDAISGRNLHAAIYDALRIGLLYQNW